MKKLVLAFMAALLLTFSFTAVASAGSYTVSGIAQLNNSSWTPMPNATDRYCSAPFQGQCIVSFRWTGTTPGKDTSIRMVYCNGVENDRVRIPGGQGSNWWQIPQTRGIANGTCFRIQGRNPTESGNMANAHFFEWRAQWVG